MSDHFTDATEATADELARAPPSTLSSFQPRKPTANGMGGNEDATQEAGELAGLEDREAAEAAMGKEADAAVKDEGGEGGKLKVLIGLLKKVVGVKDLAAMYVFWKDLVCLGGALTDRFISDLVASRCLPLCWNPSCVCFPRGCDFV